MFVQVLVEVGLALELPLDLLRLHEAEAALLVLGSVGFRAAVYLLRHFYLKRLIISTQGRRDI